MIFFWTALVIVGDFIPTLLATASVSVQRKRWNPYKVDLNHWTPEEVLTREYMLL
jgi:hypothetical protein